MSETLRDIPSEGMATQPDLEAELCTSGVIDPHDHLFWYVYVDSYSIRARPRRPTSVRVATLLLM
jgi:hypothetical protein